MSNNIEIEQNEKANVRAASINLSKTGPLNVFLGGSANYSVDAVNTGTEDLTNWVLEDTLPSQVNILRLSFDNGSSPSYDVSIRTSDAPGTDKQVITGQTTPVVGLDLTFYTPPGERVLSVKINAPTFTMGTPKNNLFVTGIVNTTAHDGEIVKNTAVNTADSSTGPVSYTASFNSTVFGSNPGFIGWFVWDDLNGDGIYQIGEPGINGVTVELYDSTGSTLLETTTTTYSYNQPGYYTFPLVEAGQYLVKFIPPAGYELTVQKLVHNGSTPNPVTGFTNVITLAENESDVYVNAGLIVPKEGGIGDFVWDDLNGDGIYEPNEPGVNGVTVELYDGTGTTLLKTTTTANNVSNQPGYYSFAGLAAGTYKVKFIPPVNYTLTIQNLGANGSTPDPATGFTNEITITGTEVLTTINAGVLSPCLPPVINTTIYSVKQNSVYDPMQGVTAFDCKGNNITADVIVTQNTVNTAVPGQYTVSYSVTDSRGQTTTKTITVTVYAPSPYEQAVSDLIESVALQETGISHILNAEGEKIQKVLTLTKNSDEIIRVNDSVKRVIRAVENLEIILQKKLSVVECEICNKFAE